MQVLEPARTLTPADMGVLLLTVEAWAFWRKMQRACNRRRSFFYTATGSTGQTVQRRHPEYLLLDQARKQYLRMLESSELTPVSRNRVKAAKLPPTSGVEEFFNKT